MVGEIIVKFQDNKDIPLTTFTHGIARTLDILVNARHKELIDQHERLENQIFRFKEYLESRGAEMRDMSEMLDLYNNHFNIR